MADIKIGHSKISVVVEGCIGCGDRWSSGWYTAREIPVVIGDAQRIITIHRCQRCQDMLQAKERQLELIGKL